MKCNHCQSAICFSLLQQQKQTKTCKDSSHMGTKHIDNTWSKEWMSSCCPSTVTTDFQGDKGEFPVELQTSSVTTSDHQSDTSASSVTAVDSNVLQDPGGNGSKAT